MPNMYQPLTVDILDYDNQIKYENLHTIDGKIEVAVNNGVGRAEVTIDDHNNEFHDTTKPHRPTVFKNGWILRIKIGGIPWFVGIIKEPYTDRPGANQQRITINALQIGIVLGQRIGKFEAYQQLHNGGTEIDPNDNSTRIDNLIKGVLSDGLAHPQLGPLGITAGYIDPVDVRLPVYEQSDIYLSTILTELADIGGGIYFVDADRKFNFYNLAKSHDSGLLLTNNRKENWPDDKTLILKNKKTGYRDSSFESNVNAILFLGSQFLKIDYNATQADALFDLGDHGVSASWLTVRDNLRRTYLGIRRIGQAEHPITISVSSIDGQEQSLIERHIITASQINNLPLNVSTWIQTKWNRPTITPGETLVLSVDAYPTGNVIQIPYSEGEGDKIQLQVYSGTSQRLLAENTEMPHQFVHEQIVNLPNEPSHDTASLMAEAILTQRKRIRRDYNKVVVSISNDPPPLGRTVRIKDIFNGLDTQAIITGYDVHWSENDADSCLGPSDMILTLAAYI